MSPELDGKVAIITGGGSGLGREIALAYAEQGAAVVVSSSVAVENEAVAQACRNAGGRAIAVEADVRHEPAMDALVGRCLAEFGRLDVLVAAAGIDPRESQLREDRFLRHVTPEQWRRLIDVNLTGTYLAMRSALRPMTAARSGSIITFSSGTVRAPRPGLAAYVSSKSAIEGLTRVLALEVEPDGIRVNALQPGGPTNTPFFPDWLDDRERTTMHDASVIRGAATFLASDASRDVTGTSVVATAWNRERGLQLCGCAACGQID